MQTLAEIYERYKSPASHGDKGTVHSYIEVYEEVLAPYRNRQSLNVLEIGILNGDSLRMWEEYFAGSNVYGVDICARPLDMADLTPMIQEGTHHIVLMDATDPKQVEANFKGIQFDVIIEDASHILEHQLAIYANFKHRMAPGGIYIVEDVDAIDMVRPIFAGIDATKRVSILDRRAIKKRFDDVLVLVEGF